MATRVLALVARSPEPSEEQVALDLAAHHALARQAATQAAVLLENDGVLPLDEGTLAGETVVVGEFARTPRYQGAGSSQVNPTRLVGILDALAERGLRRVLVEGGGRLVSSFLAAGALDRLFVTCAPVLIGDGVPGLRFSGTDVLADAIRPPSRRLVLGDDVCTELLLRG